MMQACPKCGAAIELEAAAECPRCGVVFAKLHTARAAADAVDPPRVPDPLPPAGVDRSAGAARIVRAVVLAGLAAWTISFARAGMGMTAGESVLHLPNLVFHEAGHIIFGFFGRFMTVLGGSLLQCLVPLVCAVAFVRQKNPFAAAVCLWWAGENLLDLAPYIADSRAMQLILLGGHTGAEVEGHDWEYLLTQLGWLHKDVVLGTAAHRAGLTIMTAALGWGAFTIRREPPEPPSP
jgi:hypothetical protein